VGVERDTCEGKLFTSALKQTTKDDKKTLKKNKGNDDISS